MGKLAKKLLLSARPRSNAAEMSSSSNGEKLKRLPFTLTLCQEAGTLAGLELRTPHFCVLWRKAFVPLSIYLLSDIFSSVRFVEEFFGHGGMAEGTGRKTKSFQTPLPLQVIYTETRPLDSRADSSSFLTSHPRHLLFPLTFPPLPMGSTLRKEKAEKTPHGVLP